MTDTQALMATIEDVDLDMIKLKLINLMKERAGHGSTLTRSVRDLRKFLALTRAYPALAIVPSGPVDKFWHNHILDTQQYSPDCNEIIRVLPAPLPLLRDAGGRRP